MWISSKVSETLDKLRTDLAEAQAEARVYREQNKVLQANMDWMRHQVNKLERQNASFLVKYAGVNVPVPEFVAKTVDVPDIARVMEELGGSFEDMGDEAAGKLGIGWNADGSVNYGAAHTSNEAE